MTRPLRFLLLSAAVAATLAACNREPEAPETPAAATDGAALTTPADAAAPMGFEQKTAWADVRLTLPEAIKAQTDLHARLYAEEVRKLRPLGELAQLAHLLGVEAGVQVGMGLELVRQAQLDVGVCRLLVQPGGGGGLGGGDEGVGVSRPGGRRLLFPVAVAGGEGRGHGGGEKQEAERAGHAEVLQSGS